MVETSFNELEIFTQEELENDPNRILLAIVGRVFDVSEGIFKERAKGLYDIPSFRNLLNEIKDPKILALRTINDLSETLTSAKLYKSLSDDFKVP